MATEITMPKLSDTMTEGQLGSWRKKIGDRIERGDIIAEVETDKATMDLEAFTSGILLEQRVPEGRLVPVGTVIGLIGGENESVTDQVMAAPAPVEPPPPAGFGAVPAPSPPIAETDLTRPGAGLQAAPFVRRRAAELGIDLNNVNASGPGGRILLEDLEQPRPQQPARETAPAAPGGQRNGEAATDVEKLAVEPLSRMREAIAKVTSNSWHSIPHFYVSVDIEMENAERAVRDLKNAGVAISLNALILTATTATLVKYPLLNATLTERGILKYATVNLGFAVAVEGGLIVPVIKDAHNMGIEEFSREAVRLASRARDGHISESEISGGTFSVSNLGMHDISSFASIIMPAQSGILALGTVADRPLVKNNNIVAGRTMTASLSCDHRIIDGAYAAAFLNEFKRLLEHPNQLPA